MYQGGGGEGGDEIPDREPKVCGPDCTVGVLGEEQEVVRLHVSIDDTCSYCHSSCSSGYNTFKTCNLQVKLLTL